MHARQVPRPPTVQTLRSSWLSADHLEDVREMVRAGPRFCGAGAALAGHRLAIKTDYGMQFSRYNGNYITVNTASAVLALNTTAHIVVTYNGTTTFKIYKDGTIFETFTLTNAIVNNTQAVTFGGLVYSTGYDEHFSGNMDEIAYFPSELTSTQVSDLYAKA